MKRLHINLRVQDLPMNIRFYSSLFKAEPTIVKPDYAKWMLDDPRVNFSLSTSAEVADIEHLGIQAENEEELQELYTRLDKLEGEQLKEGDTICCYARSNKSWIKDPQGVEWEIFHTYGESETNKGEDSNCCAPTCCSPSETTVA